MAYCDPHGPYDADIGDCPWCLGCKVAVVPARQLIDAQARIAQLEREAAEGNPGGWRAVADTWA